MSGAARAGAAGATRGFGWPRLLVLYCAVWPPAAVLIYLAFWPMWREHPLLAMGSVVLSLSLLSAGILLLDEPAQRSSAVMLLCASALLAAGWLNIWLVGPLPLISVPTSDAGTILAAWAMFCYPNSPLRRRAGSWFFTGAMGFFLAANTFYILASRPEWLNFPASASWLTLFPDKSLSAGAGQVIDFAGILFAIAYMLLWAARWRQSQGISRRLALPVAVAASVTCIVLIVELVAHLIKVRPAVMEIIYTSEAYLQIGVPAAFVVSVLRHRFARARTADLLLRLRGPGQVAAVADALRVALEDPALEVIDQTPGLYTGTDSHPAPGSPDPGRLNLAVTSSSGERLAVILADPSLSADDDLVRAAVAAASFALENAGLEAALAGQLREVRESRLRIIQAGMAERRRIERDLHDGIQGRLIALDIMLSGAEGDTTVKRARDELALVLTDLHDLVHGIHPATLSRVGLDETIRTLAARYTVPVDVDLPSGRLEEAGELTAYYVISESIANAIKHAAPLRISVRGEKSGGFLRVTVADDGCGGASLEAGTGIRGIFDRVQGIGGDASLDSPPGRGTRIQAVIPCA